MVKLVNEKTELSIKNKSGKEIIELFNSKLKLNLFFNKGLDYTLKIYLDNSEVEIKSISLLNKTKFKLRIEIYHLTKSKSNLICKTVGKESEIEILGLINISKKAEGSEANLSLATLNLNSKIKQLPILEIENKNVKASHSSSIIQINNEKLWYLMSRGLEKEKASNLIIKGFLI